MKNFFVTISVMLILAPNVNAEVIKPGMQLCKMMESGHMFVVREINKNTRQVKLWQYGATTLGWDPSREFVGYVEKHKTMEGLIEFTPVEMSWFNPYTGKVNYETKITVELVKKTKDREKKARMEHSLQPIEPLGGCRN